MAAFIVLAFFLTRHPCRIVTTSAKDEHLMVLWGEIGRFVQESKYPLASTDGGPLVVNHHHIRKVVKGEVCTLSYLKGMVAGDDSAAAMQGHHIAATGDRVPRTLFVADEASSVKDAYFTLARTWANRQLIFGNPWECQNYYRRANDEGSIHAEDGSRYWRRVTHISVEDSPNVRYARAQAAAGQTPTDEIILPGVKPWGEYVKDRRVLDKVQQCVSLDGNFYLGAELLLFPHDRLERAHTLAVQFSNKPRRVARAIGIDPAEGGDRTAMCAVDEWGILDLVSKQTPDTTVVKREAVAFMLRHGVDPQNVAFDRGGGGKQHADDLREMGYDVTTIAFGEQVSRIEPSRRREVYRPYEERMEKHEESYAYSNRRAEMYGELSRLLDPAANPDGFAIPARTSGPEYERLRKQLSVMPKLWDAEGRMRLPPKNRRGDSSVTRGERSLVEMIGHSPDEADAVVLAVHRMLNPVRRAATAGVAC